MSEKLRECPICGSDKLKITHKRSGGNKRTGTKSQVMCNRCYARGAIFVSENETPAAIQKADEKAIAAWNTRPADDKLREQLSKAMELLGLSTKDMRFAIKTNICTMCVRYDECTLKERPQLCLEDSQHGAETFFDWQHADEYEQLKKEIDNA